MKIIDHFILIDDKNSKNYKRLFDINTKSFVLDNVIDGTCNHPECLFITDDGKLFDEDMNQIRKDKKFMRLIQGFNESAIVECDGTVSANTNLDSESKIYINHENIKQYGYSDQRQCYIILENDGTLNLIKQYKSKQTMPDVFKFAFVVNLLLIVMDDQLTGHLVHADDNFKIISTCEFPVQMSDCCVYYERVYFKSVDSEWYSCIMIGEYPDSVELFNIEKMNGVIDVITTGDSMVIIKHDEIKINTFSIKDIIKLTPDFMNEFLLSSKHLYGVHHGINQNDIYLLADLENEKYYPDGKLVLSDELRHNYIFDYPYDVKFIDE